MHFIANEPVTVLECRRCCNIFFIISVPVVLQIIDSNTGNFFSSCRIGEYNKILPAVKKFSANSYETWNGGMSHKQQTSLCLSLRCWSGSGSGSRNFIRSFLPLQDRVSCGISCLGRGFPSYNLFAYVISLDHTHCRFFNHQCVTRYCGDTQDFCLWSTVVTVTVPVSKKKPLMDARKFIVLFGMLVFKSTCITQSHLLSNVTLTYIWLKRWEHVKDEKC